MDNEEIAIEEEQIRELSREETEEFVFVSQEETNDTQWGPIKPQRKINLWLSDAILLCTEHLQIYALILSLSLEWPWPRGWINGTSFAFLFNLDIWEFTKTLTVYAGIEDAIPDPSLVPFNYLGFSIAWILFLISAVALFAVLYALVPKVPFFNVVNGFLLQAKLVRLFAIIAQLFCFPFGLALVRLFNCQNSSGSNTEIALRSIVIDDTCFSSTHLGVLLPMIFVAIAYFIALPCCMIYIIRKQLLFPWIYTFKTCKEYESNLRLKEAEYKQGLDISWEVNHFYLFASFRRPWVWFCPLSYFFKGILLISYGLFFYWRQYQTIVIFALVGVAVITVSALPVYRLRSFNLMLVFSVIVNLCNLVLGMLLALGAQSSLLLGTNLNNALILINVTWLLVAIIWIAYLIISNLYFVRRKYGPFWPTLSELNWSSKQKSEHTLKYFKAIQAGRQVLERCYSGPALFAPVHKLSKQIQIINAYCREAEVIRDPTRVRLWALVNEMIDVYNHLTPLSVFRTDNILPHIQQLMKMMPAFTKRLKERESELILLAPYKRNILLKLFVIATFLEIAKKKGSYRNGNPTTEEIDEQEVVKKKRISEDSETQVTQLSPEFTDGSKDITVLPQYDQIPYTPPPLFSETDPIKAPPNNISLLSTTDNMYDLKTLDTMHS